MKSFDVVIVGAGVTGCSIARALSRYQGNICVVEQNSDICEGASKANSAIVHGGYDPEPGSKKAKLNLLGNQMMDRIAAELDVPFRRIGALVLCFHQEDLARLQALKARGEENGVEGLEILNREGLLKMEPNLGDQVFAALHVPSSGVICPFELTLGFAESARNNGAEFLLNTKVEAVRKVDGGYTIRAGRELLFCRALVNAAGVYGDWLHNMLGRQPMEILPRAGEYLLLDRTAGGHVSRTLFQLPTDQGKGVLVSPTVHGNLLLGPTSRDQSDKEGTETTASGLAQVEGVTAQSVKDLPMGQVITSFTGLRAHISGPEDLYQDDFYIEESAPGFFEAVGIDSPGLSAAPAIGEEVAEMVAKSLHLRENPGFRPNRKAVPKLSELPLAERREMIEKRPEYGKIICRCEEISEGEILDAIRRPIGATTLDGVKRRTRAGMGRCQGGFCSPRVMALLQQELGCKMQKVRKNQPGSELVRYKTRGTAK